MRLAKFLLCLGVLLLLTACSGTYRSYADMLKFAFSSGKENVLTFGTVNAAAHDYLYVKYGDRPQAALGLMFIEREQFKWVSADNAMLVTEHGRIVKTLGLDNDMLFVSNLVNDPLKHAVRTGAVWLRAADWQSGEYGYAMRSQFAVHQNEFLTFFGHNLAVTKIIETVTMQDVPDFWRFDGTWQNTYWINTKTGQLVQSEQQLAPGLPVFQLVFISEVVRHFNREGISIPEDAL